MIYHKHLLILIANQNSINQKERWHQNQHFMVLKVRKFLKFQIYYHDEEFVIQFNRFTLS